MEWPLHQLEHRYTSLMAAYTAPVATEAFQPEQGCSSIFDMSAIGKPVNELVDSLAGALFDAGRAL